MEIDEVAPGGIDRRREARVERRGGRNFGRERERSREEREHAAAQPLAEVVAVVARVGLVDVGDAAREERVGELARRRRDVAELIGETGVEGEAA